MRFTRTLYGVLILILCSLSFSEASTIRLIKPNGLTYSFNKIQKAITAAQPGDKVLIPPGVHFEILRIIKKKGEKGKPIIIEGTKAETCIIDGAFVIHPKKEANLPSEVVIKAKWKETKIKGKKCYFLDTPLKVEPIIARDSSGTRIWHFASEQEFIESPIPLGTYYDKKHQKLYLKAPNSFDPNNETILISRYTFTVEIRQSSFIILRNLTIRNGGAASIQIVGSPNIELSNLIINGGQRGIYFKDPVKGVRSSNVFIHDCKVIEKYDPEWFWSDFKTQKPRKMEGSGIYIRRAGSNNRISNCQISGFFNGISVITSRKGFNNPGLIIDGNTIHNIMDDGIELDCTCINGKVYKNTLYDVFVGISLAPCQGPVYIYRNVVLAGKVINFDRKKNSRIRGPVLKIGGTFRKPTSDIYIYNNTLCDPSHVVVFGYQNGVARNLIFLNNIFMTEWGYTLYFNTKNVSNLNFIRNLYYKRKKGDVVRGWRESFKGKNIKIYNCIRYRITKRILLSKLRCISFKLRRVDQYALKINPRIIAPFDYPPDPRLRFNSPAIDAGINLKNCLSLPDCVTIKDGFIDIGAVEYIPKKYIPKRRYKRW